MRLILFDIDGTLMTCGPQAGRCLLASLREVFGTFGTIDGYSFAGRTDPEIIRDLLTPEVGAESASSRLDEVRALYGSRLIDRFDPAQVRLMPGVVDLLEKLHQRADVLLGVLTGNFRNGAMVKLSGGGISDFFSVGAYGDDGHERSDLVPVALERAREHAGFRFSASDALIVGDTVHDVACGSAHSVDVLGVATGSTSLEDLSNSGARWAVPSLSDPIALDVLLDNGRGIEREPRAIEGQR